MTIWRRRAETLRHRMQPRTLRTRLVLVVSGLLLVALAVFGWVSFAILRQSLVLQSQNTLDTLALYAQPHIQDEIDIQGRVPAFGEEIGPMLSADTFYFVLDSTGTVTSAYLSRDYDYRELTSAEIGQLRLALGEAEYGGEVSVDGIGDFLVALRPLEGDSGARTLIVGVGLNEVNDIVGAYALWVVVIGAGVAAIGALVGLRVVRSAMRPLERVAAVADHVSQTPLDSGEVDRQVRVPRDGRHTGSEADRVAEALNRLLDHVETSLNTRHRTEESMRRFIAEASHELRNPLAVIRGYADFYAQPGADAGETAGALGRIGAEATRMSTLVDDLLLLAKLDADPRVRREEVELARVVVEVIADARFAYPDHVWRLTLPEEPADLLGDEDAIRQMLLNLIANAGHHTPPGTEVVVALAQTPDVLELSVTDDGPGIPASALPTLFDRFTQVEDTTEHGTRERTTVGLGLAIVRALADAAGYTVTVETGSEGSRFTLRIPHPAAG